MNPPTDHPLTPTAQEQRRQRAHDALRSGTFQITRTGPLAWSVQNGDKLPYAVTLNDGGWTCSCPDFRQRGPNITCKHIEAVRLLETEPTHANSKEEHPMSTEIPANPTERTLWELRQPLDMARVKRRQAPGSGSVPYLEGYDVIERANEIFNFRWSFSLLSSPSVMRWHKKALVWDNSLRKKVALVKDGEPVLEEVGVIYVTGKVTIELDGRSYEHADLGRCLFAGDTPEALDMALAGSVTDCLKRCLRQIGDQFGNALYDKEIAQSAGLPPQGEPRAAKPAPAPVRQYGDGSRVNGNASEQEAFDQYLKSSGSAPASKDALRAWMASRHAPAPATAA